MKEARNVIKHKENELDRHGEKLCSGINEKAEQV